MPNLTLPSSLADELRPTAAYAAALVHALAREEHAGRRPRRLTEAGHATWERFRGRLGPRHFLELLAEDAAVSQGVPFDVRHTLATAGAPAFEALDDAHVGAWIDTAAELDLAADGTDYVMSQARLLGLPDRMARSELHRVQPHQKVLELPGTGGQLCHHLAVRDGVFLQDNATIACSDWRELVLAGLIAVELGAPHADFAQIDPALEHARQDRYDVVVGRTRKDDGKGGRFSKERLHELFPNAEIVLV